MRQEIFLDGERDGDEDKTEKREWRLELGLAEAYLCPRDR